MADPNLAEAGRYPPDSVERLLQTDLVTAPTRAALEARLTARSMAPEASTPALYAVLTSACERLIPQADPGRRVDIAAGVDARIARGDGDGWRYDSLPPDAQAHRQGLAALDEGARDRYGAGFAELASEAQDQLLGLCQAGDIVAIGWGPQASRRWFEEIVAAAAETYYSHPWAQSDIGYAGMADAQGWTAIGLDTREAHEPVASQSDVFRTPNAAL